MCAGVNMWLHTSTGKDWFKYDGKMVRVHSRYIWKKDLRSSIADMEIIEKRISVVYYVCAIIKKLLKPTLIHVR